MMMYVTPLALLSFFVVACQPCAAWMMPAAKTSSPSSQHPASTTTVMRMNIFADFFKMPSYVDKKKPEEEEKTKHVEEEKTVPHNNAEKLEVPKEELTEHRHQQHQEEHPDTASVSPAAATVVADVPDAVTVVESAPPREREPTVAASRRDRLEGTVEWFSIIRGYGFIHPNHIEDADDRDENVFVHHSAIAMDGFRKLRQGQTVRYSVQHDDAGRTRAVDVSIVQSPSSSSS